MRLIFYGWFLLLFVRCSSSGEEEQYTLKTGLPKQLKETSGLAAAGNALWAVSDNPKQPIVKLDKQGEVLQEITLAGTRMEDAEAMTSDGQYLYIGDVGDNKGDRGERKIYKVALAAIGTSPKVQVPAEVIRFSFDGQTKADKKKENEFDCEAMLHHNGFLYLITKRRTDKDAELFKLPITAGTHTAVSMGVFSTNGMITGGAINPSGTEVALTGYHKGHIFPFILLLSNFSGDAFFNGKAERIELADKKLDWQVESITYDGSDMLYFACENTDDVPATLYGIKRTGLSKINQKK